MVLAWHCLLLRHLQSVHLPDPEAEGSGGSQNPRRLGMRPHRDRFYSGLHPPEHLHPHGHDPRGAAVHPRPRAHPSGQGRPLVQDGGLSGAGAALVQSAGVGSLHPAVQGHRDRLRRAGGAVHGAGGAESLLRRPAELLHQSGALRGLSRGLRRGERQGAHQVGAFL